VTSEQLRAARVDVHRIRRWVADGRLHREHRGVYAVGHPGRSVLGDYMSAVLAAGSSAVLSHRSAAYLLRLLPGGPPPPEVTISTFAGRTRPGIVLHRVRELHVLDTSQLHAIPVTIVPRTLLDLAPALSPSELTRACHEAWIHHHTSPRQIEACTARNASKPGAHCLRRALGADVTLSVLEDEFLTLLRSHDLPAPRTNVDHRGDRVDCHWPQLGLTVELLSYRFHGSRHAFEQDVARRRRSNHSAFTYGDVSERSEQTIAEVASLIAHARAAVSASA